MQAVSFFNYSSLFGLLILLVAAFGSFFVCTLTIISSMLSLTLLFQEVGPHRVNADMTLSANAGTWNRHLHLLLIDTPLGTGYSSVNDTEFIPKNELDVSKQLFAALQHFFVNHADLQQSPFFIVGESYGGKFAPGIISSFML